MKKYISIQQAADWLDVSRQTINNMVSRGALGVQVRDGIKRVCSDDVKKVAESIEVIRGDEKAIEDLKRMLKREKEMLEEKVNEVRQSSGMVMEMLDSALRILQLVIEKSMPGMTDRERQVAEIVTKEPATNYQKTRDVAKRMMLTRERVRQITARILRKAEQGMRDREEETERLRQKVTELKEEILKRKLMHEGRECAKETEGEISEDFCKDLATMGLSVRALNCLSAADIRTLGELVVQDKWQLMKLRCFGRKTLLEIEDFLEEKGLHLGMEKRELFRTP